MQRTTFALAAVIVASGLLAMGLPGEETAQDGVTRGTPVPKVEPVPLDADLHHFMEYMFEPTYKRLRRQMASEDRGRSAWKAIKSDSMILGEAANLLLGRLPEENAADWLRRSAETRDAARQLYDAARAKDDAKAAPAYRLMLTRCNGCHEQFAEGEPQLEP